MKIDCQKQQMREEEIPDYKIFMMCEKLNENALTELNNLLC